VPRSVATVKARRRAGDLLGVDEDAAGRQRGTDAREQAALSVVITYKCML
jgi:hypothetical protein